MDWTTIPADYFSLHPDIIRRTLPMLSDRMTPDDVSMWLNILRQNKHVPHLSDLPTSRPSQKNTRLPGIGHPYWRTARDHLLTAGSRAPKVPEEFINSTRVIDQEHFVDFINNFRKGCETQEPKPLYSINWQTPKVCFEKDLGFYFKLNVLHSKHNYFQDGSPMRKVLHSFHGTREVALKSILTNGLRSSTTAHKVLGLWLNDNKHLAATWNCSVLDQAVFVFCEISANQEMDRQNSAIMQGQVSRRISELRTGMVLPSVVITNICVGIPHPTRTQWRKNLFRAFEITYSYIRALPLQHWPMEIDSETEWASHLFQLTSARFAHRRADGAMKESFGGHFKIIGSECIPISIAFTQLLDALHTDSECNRISKPSDFQISSIPLPIREAFVTQFPELRVWTRLDLTQYNTSWTMGPKTVVDQWFTQ